MILIKILFAHFVGDFILQPKAWVDDKEKKKGASLKLYFHILVHGLLLLIVLWNTAYVVIAPILTLLHLAIDLSKLYLQTEKSKTTWFFVDQLLHLASILTVFSIVCNQPFNIAEVLQNETVWIYGTAILFITFVASLVLQIGMHKWSRSLDDNEDESLAQAGKFIGMLERLFVFTFVISGNWEAIGFLLAAKSVFRFGDLKESKDRKLTEYILIGTLLSFGIAIATGMIVIAITRY
jgi:hypothetical protein